MIARLCDVLMGGSLAENSTNMGRNVGSNIHPNIGSDFNEMLNPSSRRESPEGSSRFLELRNRCFTFRGIELCAASKISTTV